MKNIGLDSFSLGISKTAHSNFTSKLLNKLTLRWIFATLYYLQARAIFLLLLIYFWLNNLEIPLLICFPMCENEKKYGFCCIFPLKKNPYNLRRKVWCTFVQCMMQTNFRHDFDTRNTFCTVLIVLLVKIMIIFDSFSEFDVIPV